MLIASNRIRTERESRAWSQEQLAQIAGLGLRTVQRIETTGVASLESAAALAAVFELPVGELAASSRIESETWKRKGIISGLAIACSFAIVLFFARIALAEQFQIDIGANINKGEMINQKITADEGESVELQFDDQLKAIITPGLVEVNSKEMVSLSLQVFERNKQGQYTLLESTEMVHEDGGKWEILLSGTPSGNSYRLVVTPHRTSG